MKKIDAYPSWHTLNAKDIKIILLDESLTVPDIINEFSEWEVDYLKKIFLQVPEFGAEALSLFNERDQFDTYDLKILIASVAPAPSESLLLLESGDFILLETGDKIIVE